MILFKYYILFFKNFFFLRPFNPATDTHIASKGNITFTIGNKYQLVL